MAEHDERDETASRRYRELPSEEPPGALDAAILAHARRAVGRRRQWTFPIAAAAVLVLAVAVTWQVEREQTRPGRRRPFPPAQPQVLMQERAAEAPPRDQAELAKQQAPAGAVGESRREAAIASAPAPAMRAQAFSETPEAWLERTAKLRAEGRQEEADKALAEFRERYPDFRIPPGMLERVEKK